MLDFRIPKDPDVYRALAAYLLKQAEADAPFCEHCGAYADEDQSFEAIEKELTEGAEAYGTIPAEVDLSQHSTTNIEEIFKGTNAPDEQPSEAALAFGNTVTVTDTSFAAPAEPGGEVPAHLQKAPSSDPTVTISREVDISHTVAPAPGVDLDADGLPWDARIHAGSKLKKQREQTWKRIRGIDTKSPGLVEQVEAELRQALAASPANPVVPAVTEPLNISLETETTKTLSPAELAVVTGETVAPPPPATAETARLVTVTQCGEQVEVPIDKVIFPEFMGMCTASGFAADVVLAAVNAAGLQSVVLLATRPDLIPVVIAELYPVEA